MNALDRANNYYRVCGLHVRSAILFPELREEPKSDGKISPDIEFKMGGDSSRWERAGTSS